MPSSTMVNRSHDLCIRFEMVCFGGEMTVQPTRQAKIVDAFTVVVQLRDKAAVSLSPPQQQYYYYYSYCYN